MRIEGGSQGGDNLEILGGVQSVFFNSQRGDNFFLPWGGPDPNTSLQRGVCPPLKIMYALENFESSFLSIDLRCFFVLKNFSLSITIYLAI